MALQADRGVPLSTLCPKYLHSNSTSHKWPFGAIAELIDNAYDPDVSAKQFWIDKTVVDGLICLTFMDNGNGMGQETMRKMLSFGYSDKVAARNVAPIGMYGNGFKSGAMRLGRDAIVFSKSKTTSCIGMLSQSYLEKISADQIMVPIVGFENTETNFSVAEEQKASLEDILRYSPFQTVDKLLTEVNVIKAPFFESGTGTRILIWNLRSSSSGPTEFDFETERYDIRLPLEATEGKSYVHESEISLRAYCSILYRKPRMQVNIRGQKVKTQLITKSLAFVKKDNYKPNFLPKPIQITFGYSVSSKDHCGIMMYHKNRLIKAYKRVGGQLKANVKGLGVIGVIECNFLEPTHNKQSFNDNDKYRKTINNLAIKLDEYWKEVAYRRKQENPNSAIPVEDDSKRPDQNWVQCDTCLKWRKLPDGINCNKLSDQWFCHINPDPQFRSCQVEEEQEDSEDEQRYTKTYKQDERREKRRKEMEETRRQAEVRARSLENMRRQALRRPVHNEYFEGHHMRATPRTPRTPRTPKGTQAAGPMSFSPGLTHSPLIITDVRTLPSTPQRTEEIEDNASDRTPKRPRVDELQRETTPSSPPLPIRFPNVDDCDEEEADVIMFGVDNNPSSNNPDINVTKVKTEQMEQEADLLMANSTATTQTEVPKIKNEEEEEQRKGEKQQELIQAIAQERDTLKVQVAQLTEQLHNMETRLQEVTQQPEEVEEVQLYKSLFEKAQQKVDELIREKEASINAAVANDKEIEREKDEIALQLDSLYRQLEQSNKERDELRSQLDRLKEEKANLMSQCEELKLSLSRQRSHTEHNSTRAALPQDSRWSEASDTASISDASHNQCEGRTLNHSASRTAHNAQTQAVPQEARGTGASGTASSFNRLVQLRQNVAHLLSYFLPHLDLDQVNYECDVIDEILIQFLSDEETLDKIGKVFSSFTAMTEQVRQRSEKGEEQLHQRKQTLTQPRWRKIERKATELLMESLGDDAVGVSSATLPSELSSSATHKELPKVKDEAEGKGKRKQKEVKHQAEKEKRTGENVPNGNGHAQKLKVGTRDKHRLLGVEHKEAAGPSCAVAQTLSLLDLSDMNEVQKQQDQLLELMQATAQERDLLKDQVNHLTKQLNHMQAILKDVSQTSVKVCMHQASQTEKAEEAQQYKCLFEKAKQKIDEMIKEKESLLNAAEAIIKEKKEIKQDYTEMALHIDCLIQQLDQSNRERDELHVKCEKLELNCTTSFTAHNPKTQPVPEEARESEASGTTSSSGTCRRLVQLRQNVAHLLSYFVPALDLDQVNYECDVIDEILIQVLSDEESMVSVGLKSEAKKN